MDSHPSLPSYCHSTCFIVKIEQPKWSKQHYSSQSNLNKNCSVTRAPGAPDGPRRGGELVVPPVAGSRSLGAGPRRSRAPVHPAASGAVGGLAAPQTRKRPAAKPAGAGCGHGCGAPQPAPHSRNRRRTPATGGPKRRRAPGKRRAGALAGAGAGGSAGPSGPVTRRGLSLGSPGAVHPASHRPPPSRSAVRRAAVFGRRRPRAQLASRGRLRCLPGSASPGPGPGPGRELEMDSDRTRPATLTRAAAAARRRRRQVEESGLPLGRLRTLAL